MDPSRFTGEPYYGDFRDKFEELYETSSSFVRLHAGSSIEGKHVLILSNLSTDALGDHYKSICYRYEDTYDWKLTPLYCDPSRTEDLIAWRIGETTVAETSIEDGVRRFNELTDILVKNRS